MKTIKNASNFVIRWADKKDTEPVVQTMLAAFDGEQAMGDWVRMMMDGSHASANPSTIAVAEDTDSHTIAAVITCSPQIWYYEDLPLKALNITEVGTLPDYRGLGLVTRLMNMIHDTLFNENYDFSLVWGIPWFYKQYGYYQTLGNKVPRSYARKGILAKWDEQSPYKIRSFQIEDINFGVKLHLHSTRKSLISFPYNNEYWKMFVFDYFEENRDEYRIIENNHQPIGVLSHNKNVDDRMSIYMIDLIDGVSWLDLIPWVNGYLLDYGDQFLKSTGKRVEEIRYLHRENHPIFEILHGCHSREFQAEQNYYRITDLRCFLQKIAPILENRIANSFICGYTKKVSLQIFDLKQVLIIQLEQGKIKNIEWKENRNHRFHDIHMPYEYFIHLLFGQKDIDEFKYLYREVGSWNDEQGLDNEMRIFLKILFPKKPSYINHPL